MTRCLLRPLWLRFLDWLVPPGALHLGWSLIDLRRWGMASVRAHMDALAREHAAEMERRLMEARP